MQLYNIIKILSEIFDKILESWKYNLSIQIFNLMRFRKMYIQGVS